VPVLPADTRYFIVKVLEPAVNPVIIKLTPPLNSLPAVDVVNPNPFGPLAATVVAPLTATEILTALLV
jgi:hypothetical protein